MDQLNQENTQNPDQVDESQTPCSDSKKQIYKFKPVIAGVSVLFGLTNPKSAQQCRIIATVICSLVAILSALLLDRETKAKGRKVDDEITLINQMSNKTASQLFVKIMKAKEKHKEAVGDCKRLLTHENIAFLREAAKEEKDETIRNMMFSQLNESEELLFALEGTESADSTASTNEASSEATNYGDAREISSYLAKDILEISLSFITRHVVSKCQSLTPISKIIIQLFKLVVYFAPVLKPRSSSISSFYSKIFKVGSFVYAVLKKKWKMNPEAEACVSFAMDLMQLLLFIEEFIVLPIVAKCLKLTFENVKVQRKTKILPEDIYRSPIVDPIRSFWHTFIDVLDAKGLKVIYEERLFTTIVSFLLVNALFPLWIIFYYASHISK